MKKSPRKLVLRRQTLRVLAHSDLARAVGGVDSADGQCPAIVDSGRLDCATMAAMIATTACG